MIEKMAAKIRIRAMVGCLAGSFKTFVCFIEPLKTGCIHLDYTDWGYDYHETIIVSPDLKRFAFWHENEVPTGVVWHNIPFCKPSTRGDLENNVVARIDIGG